MTIVCNKCNYENNNENKFCQQCGEKFIETISKDTLMPGTMLNTRYEIKSIVKTGGFGAVYQAIDHKSKGTVCAIKEMLDDPDFTEKERNYMITRFKREKEIFHKLSHPNIVSSKDSFIENNRYYLIMDYIEGEDLEGVIKNYPGGVPEKLIIKWTEQILDGLIYLHSQNPPIVYRDVKPENIMLKKSDGSVILIDFGLARTIDLASDTTMTAVGTPQYAPEELFAGKAEPRTDIYSLGATMHYLLTGVEPVTLFYFKPVREINEKISAEIENIIIQALGRKPEDRYESAMAMKKDISALREKVFPSEMLQEKLPVIKEIMEKPSLKPIEKDRKKSLLSRSVIIGLLLLGVTGLIGIILLFIIILLLYMFAPH
jgi:eukaryotic-like serine/threonine-protein kinase